MWSIAAAKWQLARLRISLSALINHVVYALISIAKQYECYGHLHLDVKRCFNPTGLTWEDLT